MQKYIWIDLVHICICLNRFHGFSTHNLPPSLLVTPCSHLIFPCSIVLIIQLLLIPKSKLMPRSPSMPRSQPMSSYPLYSSLVFCRSQVPISVTAKCLTQPRFLSFPCPAEKLTISEDGNEAATFDLSAPIILATRSQVYWKDHSPSTGPIQSLYFLRTHSCFNTPTLTIPIPPDPGSHDLSVLDYCLSIVPLV